MGDIGNERIVLPRLMSNLYDRDGVRYAPEGINGPPVLAYVLFIFGLISLPFARHAYAACALCCGRQDHCRAIFSLAFNFFNHAALTNWPLTGLSTAAAAFAAKAPIARTNCLPASRST